MLRGNVFNDRSAQGIGPNSVSEIPEDSWPAACGAMEIRTPGSTILAGDKAATNDYIDARPSRAADSSR